MRCESTRREKPMGSWKKHVHFEWECRKRTKAWNEVTIDEKTQADTYHKEIKEHMP